ncbi:MAG: outer membrane lipoprotein-sorting protein [Verrucomicrobiales bacterium]|nr:outer membrane lipoprotein-sorting protein [Verrucomicrobiales bacterium]
MKSLLLTIASLSVAGLFASANDELLRDAEKYRGVMTGNQGIQWRVDVENSGSQGAPKSAFMAVSQGNKIYAEVIEPESAKGRKYIASSDGDMWFWKPGLSRPVAVYRRQRLSGDAAIGDIASTSFVDGYNVVSASEGEVDGEAAVVYTLQATSIMDTYAKIKYWVTKDAHLGKKAEFYTRTGSLLRTSTMYYDNEVDGKPFLSKMEVVDSDRKVVLAYSEPKLGQYSPALFDKDSLSGVSSRPSKFPNRGGRKF